MVLPVACVKLQSNSASWINYADYLPTWCRLKKLRIIFFRSNNFQEVLFLFLYKLHSWIKYDSSFLYLHISIWLFTHLLPNLLHAAIVKQSEKRDEAKVEQRITKISKNARYRERNSHKKCKRKGIQTMLDFFNMRCFCCCCY